ncbi:MAG TPA: fibronectin type III domain-containing protein [Candidatus Angelobacter sp.]|nr:fibronectin type III domain-containing protein [Candidatus Angelobacter sp.]
MKTMFLSIIFLCVAAVAQGGYNSPASGPQGSTGSQPAVAITNGPVAEFISDSSATIGWTASKSGSMSIKYGPDRDHMNQTAQAVPSSNGASHHVHLQQLAPNTGYFFQVLEDGQSVGGVGTFHTTAPGSAPIRSRAVIPQ